MDKDTAERFMIVCITRRRDCQVGDCKNCGWLRDEQKQMLYREEVKIQINNGFEPLKMEGE